VHRDFLITLYISIVLGHVLWRNKSVFRLEWRPGLKTINLTEFRLTGACVIADVSCVARVTVHAMTHKAVSASCHRVQPSGFEIGYFGLKFKVKGF
jgi:hypothetical protein